MFRYISDIKDVTAGLATTYLDQVGAAGPVIGVLRIEAHVRKLQSPPAPSPVGADLAALAFETWKDIRRYLESQRTVGEASMGKRKYNEFTNRIEQLSREKERLLALSVPLLIEGLMNSSSSTAQDALLALILPIVEGSNYPLRSDEAVQAPPGAANATIVAVLHAGRVPFLLTCHTVQTLNAWWSEMEAATTLLIPPVVVQAERSLPDTHRQSMFSALMDEIAAWKRRRPVLGDNLDWRWLPKLV